jgi:septal ring factor EnvC (AmiA/AmiB activator)
MALPHALLAAGDDAAKLEQLRQQIRSLRAELSSDRAHKQDLQSQLRNMEKRIGKLSYLIKTLDRHLHGKRRELRTLKRQQASLHQDLQGQRVELARQIRAAYATGQQEYLKILLNQQEPAAVARTLTYYDYYNRARLQRIHSIDASLTQLSKVEDEIHHKTAELEQTRQEQSRERQQLEGTREERSQLLAKLQQQIQAKGARLAQMLEDEQHLQSLVDRLAESPLEIPSELGERQAFPRLKGRLHWPSAGRISARYGSSRKVGGLRWQGVNISAPEGTAVRAISHGRVAFSDWLRGFGLLIIIDHGDGYMSLYGGNQSLYKEVGDWVEEGEIIAGVGNSGGHSNTALYFEIRHNGKPVNPLKWCRGKPKRIATR